MLIVQVDHLKEEIQQLYAEIERLNNDNGFMKQDF